MMDFIQSYKQLDALCKEYFGVGIKGYIKDMNNADHGEQKVEGWLEDYRELKHYRYVYEHMIKGKEATVKDLITEDDVAWIVNFGERIKQGSDPLALYEEKTSRRRKKGKAKEEPKVEKQEVPAKEKVEEPVLEETTVVQEETVEESHEEINNVEEPSQEEVKEEPVEKEEVSQEETVVSQEEVKQEIAEKVDPVSYSDDRSIAVKIVRIITIVFLVAIALLVGYILVMYFWIDKQ